MYRFILARLDDGFMVTYCNEDRPLYIASFTTHEHLCAYLLAHIGVRGVVEVSHVSWGDSQIHRIADTYNAALAARA